METLVVLAILALSLVLFVQNKLRVDFVALLVLALLMLFGLIGEKDAFSGLANPVVITIACMLVLSRALETTGVISYLVFKIKPYVGNSVTGVLLFVVAICGLFSAFINNTAAVAIMIPIINALSKEKGLKKEQLLMPLSFAAQFGGMCTLIGTSPNLLVNQTLLDNGLEGFEMFSFSQVALIFFVVGTIYLIFASKYILSKKKTQDEHESYDLKDYLIELRVLEGSKLIDKQLNKNDLNDIANVRIIQMIRGDDLHWATEETLIQEGDKLILRADVSKVLDVMSSLGLENWASEKMDLEHHDLKLIEVVVSNKSNLINRTISQLHMLKKHKIAILGVKRHGVVLRKRISEVILHDGDSLLLQGERKSIQEFSLRHDFLVLNEHSEMYYNKDKMLTATLTMAAVIAAVTLNLTSILQASFLAVIFLILSKTIRLSQCYRAIDIKVIVLIACLLPLSQVMQDQGLIEEFAQLIQNNVNGYSPYVLFAIIYFASMIISAFMSNAVCAILMTPVAISLAASLSINYYPLVLAVMFASSSCFSTPVGYQTNLMVMSAGNYTYSDFIKVGVLLNIIFFVMSIFIIPIFFPF
jgi:di/tricarboxylate transporter